MLLLSQQPEKLRTAKVGDVIVKFQEFENLFLEHAL